MLRKFIQRREVDQTTDTTQKDHTIISGFKAGAQFDDRLDISSEISHVESLKIVLRGFKWLKYVKALFVTRWAMRTVIIIPGLFLGWFAKNRHRPCDLTSTSRRRRS